VDVRRQVEQAGAGARDERELRVAVLSQLRRAVPFDAHVWLLTDPASCVGWSPVADVPELADLPELILAKYLTASGRWTTLTAGVVTTLIEMAHDDLSPTPLGPFVRSRYSIPDVASVALQDGAGCWGFIDLWRRDVLFDAADRAALAATAAMVTPALRRALLPTFETSGTSPVDGPAVLLLDDDLRPVVQTPASTRYLEALLPPGPGQAVVPAAALNVAAQLRAVEAGVDDHPPEARISVPERSWMTIRAGRPHLRRADDHGHRRTGPPGRAFDPVRSGRRPQPAGGDRPRRRRRRPRHPAHRAAARHHRPHGAGPPEGDLRQDRCRLATPADRASHWHRGLTSPHLLGPFSDDR
jgi:hypothetical protein